MRARASTTGSSGRPLPLFAAPAEAAFVGDDLHEVRERVRGPFMEYLRTSTDLINKARWEQTAFARRETATPWGGLVWELRAVNHRYLDLSLKLPDELRAIEPAVRPLGWDWRIGCAAIASFPAREVVVGTMGVLYDLGGDDGAQA